MFYERRLSLKQKTFVLNTSWDLQTSSLWNLNSVFYLRAFIGFLFHLFVPLSPKKKNGNLSRDRWMNRRKEPHSKLVSENKNPQILEIKFRTNWNMFHNFEKCYQLINVILHKALDWLIGFLATNLRGFSIANISKAQEIKFPSACHRPIMMNLVAAELRHNICIWNVLF